EETKERGMSEEKKGNGHDMAALMVEVLLRIEREQKETNKRLDIAVARIDALRTDFTTLFHQMGAVNESLTDLRADVKAIRQDLSDFKGETRGELTAIRQDLNDFKDETRGELMAIRGEVHATNERLDRLTDRVDKLRDQDARIVRLEAAVFKAT